MVRQWSCGIKFPPELLCSSASYCMYYVHPGGLTEVYLLYHALKYELHKSLTNAMVMVQHRGNAIKSEAIKTVLLHPPAQV